MRGKDVFLADQTTASLAGTNKAGGKLRLRTRDTTRSPVSQKHQDEVRMRFRPQLTVDRMYLPEVIPRKSFVITQVTQVQTARDRGSRHYYKFDFRYNPPDSPNVLVEGWWTVEPSRQWAVTEFACRIDGNARGGTGSFQIQNAMHGTTWYRDDEQETNDERSSPLPARVSYKHENRVSQGANRFAITVRDNQLTFDKYDLAPSDPSEFTLDSLGLGWTDKPAGAAHADGPRAFLMLALLAMAGAIALTLIRWYLKRRLDQSRSSASEIA